MCRPSIKLKSRQLHVQWSFLFAHTWVTPLRSMRKRLMLQLPLLMELSMPWLMISARRFLPASNADALFALDSVVSACASMSTHGQDGM